MDETEIKKIKVLNSFLLKELSGSKVRIKKLEEENQILKVEYEKIKKENENKIFELKDSSDSVASLPKSSIIHTPKIGKYKQENEEFKAELKKMKIEHAKIVDENKKFQEEIAKLKLCHSKLFNKQISHENEILKAEQTQMKDQNKKLIAEISKSKNFQSSNNDDNQRNSKTKTPNPHKNTIIIIEDTLNPSEYLKKELIEDSLNQTHWQSPVWKHFTFIKGTKSVKCNYCPKIMARNSSSMHQHLKRFHDIEDNIPLGSRRTGIKYNHVRRIKCDKCYKMVNDMDKHNAARHEKCSCGQCGKEFSNKFRLNRHINQVHNKIPHHCPVEECQCKICHKILMKTSLKMHMKSVHEKIKDYLCKLCGIGFSRSDALRLHIKTVHEGRKDKVCNYCGKAFSRIGPLSIHIETVHKGIKRWQCENCNRAYGQSHELKKHLWSVHKKQMYV